jgi:transcriptional regulator with XRE-family HTH domain
VSRSTVTKHHENGQRIERARKLVPSPNGGRQHWISQEDFAPLVGTTRRHVIRLENGEHRPSGELRDRIVEVTGTTEQIESSDDEEEDMLLEIINSLIRQRQHKIRTGDPNAVLK